MDPELRFDYGEPFGPTFGPPQPVIDPVIEKPVKPEEPPQNFKRTGMIRLGGYTFVLGKNQTINDVSINEPILYQLDGRLYYEEKGKKTKLEESTMFDDLVSGLKAHNKKKEDIVPVNKLPKTPPKLKRITSDASNLNDVKYPNSETIIQKNGEVIIYAGIIGLLFLLYKNTEN